MKLEDLQTAVKLKNFKVTLHALQEKEADDILLSEIKESFQNAEVIENYPEDKPFPSCLVLGFDFKNEPIHSVWAYDEISSMAVLITVYRPDSNKWVEYKKRKNQ